MKRDLLLSIGLLLVSVFANGQTQQGYVKTKGRMGKNNTVIAGSPIPGATITIRNGNRSVSGAKGTFSLMVPSKTFFLQNVQKIGYVLTDPDVLSKQYNYSSNQLVLVLETPTQLSDDKLAAERQFRRTLQRLLDDKIDELEALKEQNRVTQEEYRRQHQIFEAERNDNEKLVSELAERYSLIDFDEEDEFNRKLSQFILDGKLHEADSLLNTKGDIHTRAMTLRQHQEANAQTERELKKQQKKLEKSKAMTQKELADLGQDCYRKYEIFRIQHRKDSAEYFIDFRASLDSTNAEWQNDAGNYARDYLADYAKAMQYYEKGLELAIRQDGEQGLSTATSYNNIGNLMFDKGQYDQALDYYQKALTIKETLLGEESQGVATYLNNIGNAYHAKRDYGQALMYHQRALNIRENLLGVDHPDVAGSFNNIGAVYRDQKNYVQAMDYYKKALTIREKTLGLDHPNTATTYNNIGLTYQYQGNDDQALDYYQKALSIREEVLGKTHPLTASSYNNIGSIYYKKRDMDQALDYLLKALAIREKVFGQEHPNTANSYNNVASAYREKGEYTQALDYFQKALTAYEKISGPDSSNVRSLKEKIEQMKQIMAEKQAKE